jgi:hypothetical protein
MGGMVIFKLRPVYPGENSPGNQWIDSWVEHAAGLEALEEKKTLKL